MEAKLRLALKNPVLLLALRASLLALAIFWLRLGSFGLIKPLVFIFVFLFLYLRPSIGASKHFFSALVLILMVFWTPQVGGLMGFYVNLTLSVLGFMLLGVKNLIFVRKQTAYYLMHLILILGMASLLSLGIISTVIFFAFVFMLFREFYLVMAPGKPQLLNLISAVEAMLVTQIAWVTSFFPSSFLVSAAFMVLATYLFHDALINYIKDTFTDKIAWRSLWVFLGLSILILLLPVWGFQ